MRIPRLTNEIIDQKLIYYPIIRLDDIINNKTPIRWQCLNNICGHVWITAPSHLFKKNKGNTRRTGCPKCGIKRRVSILAYTTEEVDLILKDRNIKRLGEYINNNTHMQVQCLNDDCNHEWPQRLRVLLTKGCPICNIAGVNEKLCHNILKSVKNCDTKHEYSLRNFDKSLRKFRVDFYLEQINIIIEYNGIQHYEPHIFTNRNNLTLNEVFEKQKLRDRYIRDFCKNKNIELIEIDGRKYKGKKLEKLFNEEIIPYLESKINGKYKVLNEN